MRTLIIAGHVLEIHSDGARTDRRFHGLRHVLHGSAVARFQIRGYRSAHRTGNPRYHIQHLVPRDSLTVRIAPRESYCRAAGRNGRMAAFFQNPRAYHIPSVRKHEHSRPVMKLSELFSFFGLYAHIHRNLQRKDAGVNSALEPKVLPYLAKRPIWRGILPASFLASLAIGARKCFFIFLSKLPRELRLDCVRYLSLQIEVSTFHALFPFSSIPRAILFSVSVQRDISS